MVFVVDERKREFLPVLVVWEEVTLGHLEDKEKGDVWRIQTGTKTDKGYWKEKVRED